MSTPDVPPATAAALELAAVLAAQAEALASDDLPTVSAAMTAVGALPARWSRR